MGGFGDDNVTDDLGRRLGGTEKGRKQVSGHLSITFLKISKWKDLEISPLSLNFGVGGGMKSHRSLFP